MKDKIESGPSLVPKREPKASKELIIRDLEDGSKWTIKDETIVELLKKHHLAPDQKTKDKIFELLKAKVASPGTAVKQFQESLKSSGSESKISAELQKLKLDRDSKASVKKRVGDSKADKVSKKK